MATSPSSLDDEDVFVGDFADTRSNRVSGGKRGFGELDDDDDDIFGNKKANLKVEETAPGETTGMIIKLRESLRKCEEDTQKYEVELLAAKSEVQKWHSSFENESFVPGGAHPEPRTVVNYLQTLRSSEESLKDQLEKAKKKEAAFVKTFAKRDQEIAELKSAVRELRGQLKPPSLQSRKLLLDPAIHEEFTRLKNLVEEKDQKVKELQEQNNALAFNPQSKFGKMLMAKCKTLQEENEEIGYLASEGKMNELAIKLALQRSQNAELRSQYEALYKHAEALANDMEKSNETVIILQEKLVEKDVVINSLRLALQKRDHVEEDNAVAILTTPVKEEVQTSEDAEAN
ncbi:FKBP12-interacting protein of 37 kDa-like protein [Drosera capensis]